MRVHELAKELGISSNELMDRLHALGLPVSNRLSALEPEVVERVRAAKPVPAAEAAVPPARPPKPSPAPAAPSKRAAAPPPAPSKAAPPPAPPPPPPSPPPRAVPVAAAPAPPAAAEAPPQPAGKVVTLKGPVVVRELAEILGLRPNQVIAELMRMNVLASINERVEIRDAQRVAEKHGVVIEREKKPEHKPPPKKEATPAQKAAEDVNKQIVRPPVVVFMGHVDHGKTSLLDRIRHASVAAGEAGGITQHIGAYRVAVGPQHITFLDTPGHEAFTAMRARGAHLTDIAVIVIAADDGVMPQTEEAIKHAEAAEVPLLVAINKVDLKTANADRVKQQLAAMGKTPEDWGGEVICCPVSAATGEGLDHLLEMILLQAEMLELRAAPNRRARGYVVESRLEAGMGPTATLLVTEGTLRPSDPLVCGPCWGRIRALIDERGVKVKEAGPSTPVQCLGLNGVPDAGAEFKVLADEKDARAEAEQRLAELRAQQVAVPRRASLDTLFQKLRDSDKLELRVVLKTDVQGSLEAIQKALEGIRSDKVTLRILLAAVGNVTANDVLLASASKAAVLGFHVAADEEVIRLAKQQGVEIRLHSIIYDLVDQVRDAMAGLLEPVLREKVVGHARLQQVFTLSHNIVVAGCLVTDGHVTPRVKVRVKRQDDVLYEGSILSLRRHQNDAAEVREGQECGIRLDNFAAFAEGDILEFYVVERIPQTL